MSENQCSKTLSEVDGIFTASEFPTNFAIISLARLHRATATDLLRKVGLFPGQEMMLMQLWKEDNQSQNALCKSLGINHSTVAKSVRRLEDVGLVTMKRSDLDKRVTLVSLTQAGMDIKEEVLNVWRTVEQVFTENLTEDEKTLFLDLMKKILNKG
ncbi:MarR family winged helix-turn-helix transcriptional regulator [Solibacillus sp. FSL K6-1523]|uniref:MarR family winged helix-turn-helix transcriptional regulator n=1 Tax=Solibacillus sp. FSL K6-1523 TaxID=2921471 RepID=UPI0030F6B5DF